VNNIKSKLNRAPTEGGTRHAGPPLGLVATIFAVLVNASLAPVSPFGAVIGVAPPYFPVPSASAASIEIYFATHRLPILICAVLQFGAAIPLGIFTATVVSRLRFLGVRAAGSYIALFGGLAATLNSIAAASVLWVMAHRGIAEDATLVRALYYLQFALGGPGYSVPLGLLLAGVSMTAGFMRLLPRWVVAGGLVIAVVGEISWISLFIPSATFLVPLTRFPAFVWLIAVGFALPTTTVRVSQLATHGGSGRGSEEGR
jgi:hypothetical protein